MTKELNKIEPVAVTERKIDKDLEKRLQFPTNPSFQVKVDLSFHKKQNQSVLSEAPA